MFSGAVEECKQRPNLVTSDHLTSQGQQLPADYLSLMWNVRFALLRVFVRPETSMEGKQTAFTK